MDTAYALQALAVGGEINSLEAGGAVSFLLQQQRANGSWQAGEELELYTHIQVLQAIWHYRHRFSAVPTAVERGKQYLLNQRSQWSEPFLSALALRVLIPTFVDKQTLALDIDALRSQQLNNGSWANDVYTTALALQVLALANQSQANPDLGTILGRVTDGQTGHPLSAATITLTGAVNAQMPTDATGYYQLMGLASGVYQLTVSRDGYAALTLNAPISLGQRLDLGTLALLPTVNAITGTILGTVQDGNTHEPLAEVSIQVNGVEQAQTQTDGRYQISPVSPGAITLSASKPGYTTASATSTVTAGGSVLFNPQLTSTTQMQQGASVSGTIADGQSQLPLAGVTVTVTGMAVAQTVTDDQGQYSLSNLPAGVVTLEVSLLNYDSLQVNTTLADNSTVQFSPQLFPSNTTPPQANTTGISGVVVDSSNNQPLHGVKITLIHPQSTLETTTNAAGYFYVNGLMPDTIALQFLAKGYLSSQFEVPLPLVSVLDMGQIRLRPENLTALLPDLSLEEITTAHLNLPLDTLDITGSIDAKISNQGTALAQQAISLLAFYDADADNAYTAADTLLGQIRLAIDLEVYSGPHCLDQKIENLR